MDQPDTLTPPETQTRFSVANWLVDPSTLRIESADQEVRLEPKVMAVLQLLAAKQGEVVSRQELEEKVWAGTVVGYDAISNAIIKIRKAFGDDAQNSRVIETIPKTGYRLIAEVRSSPVEGVSGTPAEPAPPEPAIASPPAETRAAERVTGSVWPRYALVVVVVIAAMTLWLQPWAPRFEPVSADELDWPLPDKPSIAVMPFNNLTPDKDYFVDGMTEDLIIALSKLSGLFVVDRNSVFKYKNRDYAIRDVAKALGVRFIATGSMRRADNDVRINIELVDMIQGELVWGNSFDGTLEDLFGLQDAVARGIVEQFEIQLSREDDESLRRSETVATDIYDLYLQGWGHYRAGDPKNLGSAVRLFEQVLEIDPDFARARAALAAAYADIFLKRWWAESLGISERESHERARLALTRSKENPLALTYQVASEWYALHDRSARRPLAEAGKAIAINPNDPAGHLAMAYALLKDGQLDSAERSLRTAMRLDPHYPPKYRFRLGQIQFHQKRYEAAIESLRAALAQNDEDDWIWLYLAASYGHAGLIEQGRQALDEANRLRAAGGWAPLTLLAMSHEYFRWRGDLRQLKAGMSSIGIARGGEWYQLIRESGGAIEVTGATRIDVAEAKRLHDQGVVFVDMNLLWFEHRIPGAVLLELWRTEGYRFNENALRQLVDFDEAVVIYNSKGRYEHARRAVASATAIAVSRGFTNVYFFDGGLDAWREAGYPVETGR